MSSATTRRLGTLVPVAVAAVALGSAGTAFASAPADEPGFYPGDGYRRAAILDTNGAAATYVCDAAGTWRLTGTAGNLISRRVDGDRTGRFADNTWISDHDGSFVEAPEVLTTRPSTVSEGDLDWEKRKVTRSGGGALGGVEYVLRIGTAGGAAPRTTCAAGDTRNVSFNATYWLYRPDAG